MKSLTLVTSTILLVLFASAQLFAQDYVITQKGDTISCKINTPLIGALKYKIDGTNESKKIKPEEIKEYFIEHKKALFQAVINSSNSYSHAPVFMPVIEKGKINLYEMIYTANIYNGAGGTSSSTTTKVWYISKGTDTVSELKTSSIFSTKSKHSRKDEFAEMIKDNTAVYNKYIADDSFSFNTIRNIVHLYNTGQPYKDQYETPEQAEKGANPNKTSVNN